VLGKLASHAYLAGALPISLVSSNAALRIVENFASVVASPPGERANGYQRRGFGDDYNGLSEIIGYPEANGKAANGKAKPAKPITGRFQKAYPVAKAKKEENTKIEGLGGKHYSNEMAANEKKLQPKGLLSVIPKKDNPKEQVWTALTQMENNST